MESVLSQMREISPIKIYANCVFRNTINLHHIQNDKIDLYLILSDISDSILDELSSNKVPIFIDDTKKINISELCY